jgi:NADH-quinone oxidoreductase subunit N
MPVITLVVGSIIALFYYLRIITVMYASGPEAAGEAIMLRAASPSFAESATLAALALLLIWLGIFPAQLIAVLEGTGVGLT